jgi:ketosteroid isomerase-like protein
MISAATASDFGESALYVERAFQYFKLVDANDPALAAMFHPDAEVWFPKWGVARGIAECMRLTMDLALVVRSVLHHEASYRVATHGNRVVVEGTSEGVTADGLNWKVGETYAGRFCDTFEFDETGRITRLSVFVDPDYADRTAADFPWNSNGAASPLKS